MRQVTATTDRRIILAELAKARAEAEFWRRKEEARIHAGTDPDTEAEFNRQILVNALKETP